jgi:predicted GNAT family acetyltransferase
MAYTLESHRRLGLAALCIRTLAAQQVKERGYCFVYVVEGCVACRMHWTLTLATT